MAAQWTLDLIASLMPAVATSTLQFTLSTQALAFAAALALGTGLLFGIFPALHGTRPNLVSSIKGQAGQPAGAKSAARFRVVLAAAQVALSLALLATAGLFTRSLFNVSRENVGMKVDNLVTFGISPSLNGYSPERALRLFERMEDELAALPGMTGVTGSVIPVLSGSSSGNTIWVEGIKATPDTDMDSRYNEVGARYFRTLGIPLISGREFTRSDSAAAPKVAIVNEAFARKFNLGREAVGKHIGDNRDGPKRDMEIVGLVQDAKYDEVKGIVPPLYFRPYRQDEWIGQLTFYVRTSMAADQLLPTIARPVARLDPNLPVEDLRTMPQQVRENIFLDRLISILSAAFACLATLLAAVGLYGVLAYTVAQRTREIGLRIALGASKAQVRAMVFRQVGIVTLAGGAIGLCLAVALGHLAQSLLFQLQGTDPAVFCGAAAALAIVALVAGYIPARRASRLDPMQALRYE